MLAECLFKPGVKIVALARGNRSRRAENAGEYALRVPQARNNQIFIKGSFQDSRVGDAKNRICVFFVLG